LASRIPYEWGVFLLSRLFSATPLQSRLFHEAVERLRTIQTWIGRPIELNQAVSRHLFANAAKDWRLLALGDLRWSRAKKMFTTKGQEILERYRDQQPGVILVNSHFGVARTAGKMFYENGFPLTVISEADDAALFANIECKSLLTNELAPFQVIREASRELEAGRSLYISADGSQGDAGIELNFLGKSRPFRTGFAQLAIKTGAPVVPVFGTVNEHGFVHIQIHDPLDCGLDTQPKRDRIAFLVEQYARLLESYWIADPGNIREEQFLSHHNDYGIHTARTIAREIRSRAA
ncbi:MAG TPA: hypothetical protein VLA12_02440, partial [Planctomycetaceae bacterium]|nr:hypothetical protein [Planctomycetaceae bacterium]